MNKNEEGCTMKAKEMLERFHEVARHTYDSALYGFLLSLGGGAHRLCTRDTALMLGMCKRSLIEARRRLELEGLIEVEKGHGRMGATYRVVGYEGDGEQEVDKAGLEGQKHLAAKETETETEETRADEALERGGRNEIRIDDGTADRVAEKEKEWCALCCRKMGIDAERLRRRLRMFCDVLMCDGVKRKKRKDFKRHFNRWCRIEAEKRKNNTNTNNNGRRPEDQKTRRPWKTKQEVRQEQIRDRQALDYARLLKLSGVDVDAAGGIEGIKTGIFDHH